MLTLNSKRLPAPVGRTATLCIIFVAGILLMSGGAGARSDTHGDASTTLTWALGANPAGIWGPGCACTSGMAAMSLVYQAGLGMGSFGQLQPQVISSWKQTNPTTYVYHVAPGIKFSDGTTATGADVAFSMAINLNPKVSSRLVSFFADVYRISSKGQTVTVRLKHPDSTWQYVPASVTGYVYSKADYEKDPTNFATPSDLPIGTGPYMFQSYTPNSQIVLVRNPYWKGTKYPWDTIVMPIIPNPQSLLLALESGQIDGTFDVSALSFSTWITAPNVYFHAFPSDGFTGFSIDVTDGPFQDIHVREAIAYAIDRVGLVKALLYGAGMPITCIVPPGQFRSALPSSEVQAALKKIPSYTFNMAQAKAELAKSAYPNGFTTTLNVPNGCQPCIAISQNLQSSLSQIGITLNLNLMTGAQRGQILLAHAANLGLNILNTGPDNPDPADFPATRWVSSQAVPGGLNYSNWKSPTVDKLISQAVESSDTAAAARLILQGCALEAQQVSYIPVYTFDIGVALKEGWTISSAIGPFYSGVDWLQYVRAGS